MNIPGGYMDVLSAGQTPPPPFASGAIGTSFFTPEQGAWRALRKLYGSLDDPDAGGYQLSQVVWDKDNGAAELTTLEATNAGWYAPGPMVECGCPDGSQGCGCR